MRVKWACCLAGLLFLAHPAHASNPINCTLTNHTDRTLRNQLVRLDVEMPAGYEADGLLITENGEEIPYQVEVLEGTPQNVARGDIWVRTEIKPAQTLQYAIYQGRPKDFEPLVRVETSAKRYHTLSNSKIAVRVPTEENPGLSCPVLAIQRKGGPWTGLPRWVTSQARTKTDVRVLANGPLFAKVRLRHEFRPPEGSEEPLFYEMTITLPADRPFAEIEERFSMERNDRWLFEMSHGYKPTRAVIRKWYDERGKAVDDDLYYDRLEPSKRLDDTALILRPRWSPSPDVGWFFGALEKREVVGVLVARAGRWVNPYENQIPVRIRSGASNVTLELSTHRGQRYWLLFAGTTRDLFEQVVDYSGRAPAIKPVDHLKEHLWESQMHSLDRMTHRYHTEYEPLAAGNYRPIWFFGNEDAHPEQANARLAEALLEHVSQDYIPPGDRAILTNMQGRFDPDYFGYYCNGWSPIHPEWATEMVRIPIMQAVSLKDHPDFEHYRKLAENALRTDLYYSVTLPGGAGQASHGALARQMRIWADLAPICREHLKFDPAQWPRFQAAGRFLWRTSAPGINSRGRRILPLGETQPPGLYSMSRKTHENLYALAKRFYPGGADEEGQAKHSRHIIDDPERWNTEEYPGFGVLFRDKPERPEETFFAFKAGPNSGRMRGDALSFYYHAHGRRLAIDHMTGSDPLTGQEHMHNRVAFSTDELRYANMDGYARLIAFATTSVADVAVAQVESKRLREVPRMPPMDRLAAGKRVEFIEPMVYRRTVVQIKQALRDKGRAYFVIRDVYTGPSVNGTYCLHVDAKKMDGDDDVFDFDDKLRLYVAKPQRPMVDPFDYRHPNGFGGKPEATKGVRLGTAGSRMEFVTVLYPTGDGPTPKVVATKQGVRISVAGAMDEVIYNDPKQGEEDPTKWPPPVVIKLAGRTLPLLKGTDVDLERSQGEIGLFVPETGYDLGPIPDWLREQREPLPPYVKTNYLFPERTIAPVREDFIRPEPGKRRPRRRR